MKGVLLLGQMLRMLPLLNSRRKTPEVDEFKVRPKKITRNHIIHHCAGSNGQCWHTWQLWSRTITTSSC